MASPDRRPTADRQRSPRNDRDRERSEFQNEPRDADVDDLMSKFENQIWEQEGLSALCWAEHGEGETRRLYVTMDDAEKAFNAGTLIGDGTNIYGETRRCTLRGLTVVIKAHLSGNYFFPGSDSRVENAMHEDENQRFIWTQLVLRGYADIAAMLSIPACMDWRMQGREAPQPVYTVQTIVSGGPDEKLFSLADYMEWVRKWPEVHAEAGYELRKQLAKQYGRATAAFHTGGVFHNDLHAGNMLVLHKWGSGDPKDTDDGPTAKLRFIDWGMAIHERYAIARDDNDKVRVCQYLPPDNLDTKDIQDLTKYDGVREAKQTVPGVVVGGEEPNPRLNELRQKREDGLKCRGERNIGPWEIWRDLPEEPKQKLRKLLRDAYNGFLREEGEDFHEAKVKARRSAAARRAVATKWEKAARLAREQKAEDNAAKREAKKKKKAADESNCAVM